MERFILHYRSENPEDRVIADLTVRKASRELGIAPPIVLFFHPNIDEQNLFGFYTCGRIFLNCKLNQKDLIVTTLHECRHHYQAVKFGGKLDQEIREADARMFELCPVF